MHKSGNYMQVSFRLQSTPLRNKLVRIDYLWHLPVIQLTRGHSKSAEIADPRGVYKVTPLNSGMSSSSDALISSK